MSYFLNYTTIKQRLAAKSYTDVTSKMSQFKLK